jgi:hypothetical protein
MRITLSDQASVGLALKAAIQALPALMIPSSRRVSASQALGRKFNTASRQDTGLLFDSADSEDGPKRATIDPKATVANVCYREFQFSCLDGLGQLLHQESPYSSNRYPSLLTLRVRVQDGVDDETWLVERDVLRALVRK